MGRIGLRARGAGWGRARTSGVEDVGLNLPRVLVRVVKALPAHQVLRAAGAPVAPLREEHRHLELPRQQLHWRRRVRVLLGLLRNVAGGTELVWVHVAVPLVGHLVLVEAPQVAPLAARLALRPRIPRRDVHLGHRCCTLLVFRPP
eukprot:scaffold27218_cov43-Phaeocystis_antarctica.AAC.1